MGYPKLLGRSWPNVSITVFAVFLFLQRPAGAVTYYAYDLNGNQTASWYNWDDPATPAADYKHVVTISDLDSQGRTIKTRRIVGNNELLSIPDDYLNGTLTGTILNKMVYNSIGKADYTIDENKNLSKYEYDEIGNIVETRTYNISSLTGFDDKNAIDAFVANPENVLTTTRTLYDAEGKVSVTVGPYKAGDTPVGTKMFMIALAA